MAPRSRRILTVAAFLLFVVGGGYLLLRLAVSAMFPSGTTDVREYGQTMRDWSPSGLAAHFPQAIPPQATGVRFSARPGVLQGGAHVQLRMRLPADLIRMIESQVGPSAIRTYAGGGLFDHYNADRKNGLPTASFHTVDSPANGLDFPSHYTLYLLQAADHSPPSWNHGETRGVAVSPSSNEVVYWAETW